MIFIACSNCRKALSVTGDVREAGYLVGQQSDYWPDKYACFACGGPAQGFLRPEVSEAAMQAMTVIDVTPQEAFAALNGLGVPDERTCCEEVVVPLFTECGIKVRGAQPRGSMRYFIRELVFPDGTTMFLGTSPQGAVVYRISKPHSYLRVVEETNAV